ncbi:RHS repeat-associated core domain-containing protein [Thermoflexibacter ruber]
MKGLDWTAPSPNTENKFTFNSKEKQTELGLHWHDYGARNYDAQIGRFFKVDRFAEKYYNFSPYQYAANNPIRYIDVNGDSIWFSKDENGKWTFNIVGAVYDHSGEHDTDELANNLQARFANKLRGGFKKLGIGVNVQIRGVKSMKDVKKGDHLWIVDKRKEVERFYKVIERKKLAENTILNGYTADGHMTAHISSSADDIISTMIHEGGHMLGLGHIEDEDGKVSEWSTNPMSYGSWRISGFSEQQIQTIDDWNENGMLNTQGKIDRVLRGYSGYQTPIKSEKPRRGILEGIGFFFKTGKFN